MARINLESSGYTVEYYDDTTKQVKREDFDVDEFVEAQHRLVVLSEQGLRAYIFKD